MINRREFLRTSVAASLLPLFLKGSKKKEKWHHFTGTWKDGTVQGYVNGKQVSQMAFWNTALDEYDILALSNGASPITVKPGKLVWYFPLLKGE